MNKAFEPIRQCRPLLLEGGNLFSVVLVAFVVPSIFEFVGSDKREMENYFILRVK